MTDLEKANTYQEEKRVDESRKPVYHVTPPVGWMNDPNGFSIFEGMIALGTLYIKRLCEMERASGSFGAGYRL